MNIVPPNALGCTILGNVTQVVKPLKYPCTYKILVAEMADKFLAG